MNAWTDSTSHNQYFDGVQVPELPPGTLPPVARPSCPTSAGITAQKGEEEKPRGTFELTAELEASEHVDLYSHIGGVVEKVNAAIGDRVKTGKVLAELATPEIQMDVKRKQAIVEQAKAEVERAKRCLQASQAALLATKGRDR